MRSSSSISTPSPTAVAALATRVANSRGVSTLPGSFARSRVKFAQRPTTRPRWTDAATAAASAPGAMNLDVPRVAMAGVRTGLVRPTEKFRRRQAVRDEVDRQAAANEPADRGGRTLPGQIAGRGAEPARVMRIGLAALARAHERNPRGLPAAADNLRDEHVARLALELSRRRRARTLAARHRIDARQVRGVAFVLKDRDKEEVDDRVFGTARDTGKLRFRG